MQNKTLQRTLFYWVIVVSFSPPPPFLPFAHKGLPTARFLKYTLFQLHKNNPYKTLKFFLKSLQNFKSTKLCQFIPAEKYVLTTVINKNFKNTETSPC